MYNSRSFLIVNHNCSLSSYYPAELKFPLKCPKSGSCKYNDHEFECQCQTGYAFDGTDCTNIDECNTKTHHCSNEATCSDTIGSYSCSCLNGYTGNGRTCDDIDECSNYSHKCAAEAICTNTSGIRSNYERQKL